jgi:hypothetical protein
LVELIAADINRIAILFVGAYRPVRSHPAFIRYREKI